MLAVFLTACGAPEREQPAPMATIDQTPPPLPENAKTVDFNADESAAAQADSTPGNAQASEQSHSLWGVKPGQAIPINWDDLMPEGAEEELERQQAKFYEMLEKRYAANATMLADAKPFDQIEEGSTFDYMPQLGTFDAVHDLDGQLIRIPGYVVPFDFNEKRRQGEFLFVPYMGACIHTPPPPPNQIIFVRADPAVQLRDIWSPYWLEGTLTTEETHSDVGDAAYALSLVKLEPYENR